MHCMSLMQIYMCFFLMVQKYRINLLFLYSDIFICFDRMKSMKTKNKIVCSCWNNKRKSYIRDWFKYKSDNIFAAGPVVIIPILALISICLILIFSLLYLWSGEADTYSQSLWETFTRTLG
jgi:hypothetical protein